MPNSDESQLRADALRFIEHVVHYLADRGGLSTGQPAVRLLLDDIRLLTINLLEAVIRENWDLSIELYRDIQEMIVELSLMGD